MESEIYLIIVFFSFVILKPGLTVGNCSRTKSIKSNDKVFYYLTYYCCDNYEQHETGCKACPTGFTSSKGSDCVPCRKLSYGFRCAETCTCRYFERCDNILGCTPLDSIISTQNIAEFNKSDKSEEFMWKTTVCNTTEGSSETGIDTTLVFLYNILGVCILVCIGLSLFCIMKRNMLRLKIKTNTENSKQLGITTPITVQHDIQIVIDANDSTYEEIDESNMHRLPFHTSEQTRGWHDRLAECSEKQKHTQDEYLIPYQPLVPTICKQKASTSSKYTDLQGQTQEHEETHLRNMAFLESQNQYLDVIDGICDQVYMLDKRRCNSLNGQSLHIAEKLKRHSV